MLNKTIKDLDAMINSVKAVKGQAFCDLLKIHTSLTSLSQMTMKLAEACSEDEQSLEHIRFCLSHVHAMVMAELCTAHNLGVEQAQEISDWTDRLFKTIETNQKLYLGKR